MGRQHNKDEVFLEMAQQLAYLGTCDRARVGAIITREGRAVSWGYNGAPPGLPHCEENNHGWHDAPHHDDRNLSCRNSTHAEANAVAFAARQGISTEGGTLYVTVSPCETCARLLIAAGIERVVFMNLYRHEYGLEILGKGGVELVFDFCTNQPFGVSSNRPRKSLPGKEDSPGQIPPARGHA